MNILKPVIKKAFYCGTLCGLLFVPLLAGGAAKPSGMAKSAGVVKPGAIKPTKAKSKVLPSHLQKAYVIQKNAIVYTRASFDSMQVSQIPAGTLVTISKKVYRPKHRFGTFYRVYISQPQKLRAYISEIDVTPRYVKAGSGYKLNPAFKQVKKKLRYVKDFQFNSAGEAEDFLDLNDKPVSGKKLLGLITSYSWLAYKGEKSFFPAWLFGLQLTGPGLPIKKTLTDFKLLFSVSPLVDNKIFIQQKKIQKGWLLMGDFVLKIPAVEAPQFTVFLSGGLMAKVKGSFSPKDATPVEMGAGLVGAVSLIYQIHDRFNFVVEGRASYDFSESKFVPSISGGLLVAF